MTIFSTASFHTPPLILGMISKDGTNNAIFEHKQSGFPLKWTTKSNQTTQWHFQ
jgi:hypothetical protein